MLLVAADHLECSCCPLLENQGPGIHVAATLICAICLNLVGDQVHLFKEVDSFKRIICTAIHCRKLFRGGLRNSRLTWSTHSPDHNLNKHLWDALVKLVHSMEAPHRNFKVYLWSALNTDTDRVHPVCQSMLAVSVGKSFEIYIFLCE